MLCNLWGRVLAWFIIAWMASQSVVAQEPGIKDLAFTRFITPKTMLFVHYRSELLRLPMSQAMIANVPGGKEQMVKDFRKGLGIHPEDVESATIFIEEFVLRNGSPEPSGPPYLLLSAKKDLDYAAIRQELGANVKTVPLGNFELSAGSKQAVIRIDDRKALFLAQPGGPPIEAMQKKLLSLFGDNKSDRENLDRFKPALDELKNAKNLMVMGYAVPWELRRQLDEQLQEAPPTLAPFKAFSKLQAGYLTLQAATGQAEDVRLRLVGQFPDSRSAQAGLGAVKYALASGKMTLDQIFKQSPQQEVPRNLENYWAFTANYARKQIERIKTEQREQQVIVTYDLNSREFLPIVLLAMEKVRLAADKMLSASNMRQLMIAMHNFHLDHNRLPEAMTLKNGKPLHSWRVQLLPYLEEAKQFQQLRLDEPWDSEHNKKVFESNPMPKIFEHPKFKDGANKLTHYQVFYSKEDGKKVAALRLGKQVSLGQLTVMDGTSNTMAMVENSRPVKWYQPEDVEFDVLKPFPPLQGIWTGNLVQVVFFDASVRNLILGKDEAVMKALVTWGGKEQVDAAGVIE